MSTTQNPNQATSSNVGPAVNVVTWFLTGTTILSIVARIVTKKILSRLWIDDWLIFVALVPSVAMAVSVAFQVSGGLGRHQDTLSPDDLDRFQKSTYATELLYIVVLVFTKLSLLAFFQNLTPVQNDRRTVYALIGTVSLWGLSSFLVAAFQCHVPDVWTFLDRGQCISTYAFWTYFGVTNILLETTLIIFPIIVVSRLQADRAGKLLIISCFAARILVLTAQIAELVTRGNAHASSDVTYDLWPAELCSQLVQALSVISTSIPYLKPFFASLQTGMIRADDLRRRTGKQQGGYYGNSFKNALKLSSNGGAKSGASKGVKSSSQLHLKSPTATAAPHDFLASPTRDTYGELPRQVEERTVARPEASAEKSSPEQPHAAEIGAAV